MRYSQGYNEHHIRFLSGRNAEKHLQFLLGYLREHKLENQRILDYGCGTGELAYQLAELGHRVVGCDVERNAYERWWHELQTTAADKGYDIVFLNVTGENSIADCLQDEVDVVLFHTVLYHLGLS